MTKKTGFWDKTKEAGAHTWDKTKEFSNDIWEGTKETAEDVKEFVTREKDEKHSKNEEHSCHHMH